MLRPAAAMGKMRRKRMRSRKNMRDNMYE